MVRTIETSRPWPAETPLGPTGQERRSQGGVPDDECLTDSPSGLAGAGVLLQWGLSIPMPRGLHARPAPVRPPEIWCVGQERGIARGSGVFLMNTGHAPGLIARGMVCRPPFLAARQDRIGTVGQHIGVEWLELHSLTTRIPLEVLVAAVPDWTWLPEESAGIMLVPDLVECLERVWTQWHHKPQRGHRVAEWVRESLADGASAMASRPGAAVRHRRLASAGHGLRLEVRTAV